ncbi:hypothetical protein DM02DRAFT_398810 [Periconia macrospinosa]|uniref:Uncharacterized protein n=1 Tax=Periconia macrospinosa TaxID=97972 RepID=A0A2V1DSP2_9PLEO|nr:hypothetical protein DM02DRAFT_398810 [Periconia macrospinosa]
MPASPAPTVNAHGSLLNLITNAWQPSLLIAHCSLLTATAPPCAPANRAQRSIEAQSHLTRHGEMGITVMCLSPRPMDTCPEVPVGLRNNAIHLGTYHLAVTGRICGVEFRFLCSSLGGSEWRGRPTGSGRRSPVLGENEMEPRATLPPSSTRSSLVPKRAHDSEWALTPEPCIFFLLVLRWSY